MGLLHHPVLGKKGEIIASAVTNLDLHDIARAAVTFGVSAYYLITPLTDQTAMARQIIGHWTERSGRTRNPARCKALRCIRLQDTLDDAIAHITDQTGTAPVLVGTCARYLPNVISATQLRNRTDKSPLFILFGTAWGLPPEILERMDHILAPIQGSGDYNHLSVRSAVSIYLDRLCGR
ncbi:MAG: hypothetical protein CSA22_08005 [Deltaproteobacteria bacterium]|nr:MAG: hypothetical protein CSA22_08005 [Deltaproteobacteria bacterium]